MSDNVLIEDRIYQIMFKSIILSQIDAHRHQKLIFLNTIFVPPLENCALQRLFFNKSYGKSSCPQLKK